MRCAIEAKFYYSAICSSALFQKYHLNYSLLFCILLDTKSKSECKGSANFKHKAEGVVVPKYLLIKLNVDLSLSSALNRYKNDW